MVCNSVRAGASLISDLSTGSFIPFALLLRDFFNTGPGALQIANLTFEIANWDKSEDEDEKENEERTVQIVQRFG